MKKYIYTLSLLLASILFTSCEQVLQMPSTEMDNLVINSIATTNEPLSVALSTTRSLDSPFRLHKFLNYYDYYMGVDESYFDRLVVKNADVTYSVNGGETQGTLHYDDEKYAYVSDYQPKPGDNITITAVHTDVYGITRKAYGSAAFSAKPPEYEIVSRHTYFDRNEMGILDPAGLYDIYGTDSIMSITLRLKDDKSKRNFYRLIVRGVADYTPGNYLVTDIFTTDDLLLTDQSLTSSFGAWPAYFTNIFDDHMFINNEYTITVKTRKRRGEKARVLLEYQELTSDLYYYLRSVYQYRIAPNDALGDPISIHTNVNDGWGIVGGANASTKIIYFEK